jgi:gliding motility-associated-like protein
MKQLLLIVLTFLSIEMTQAQDQFERLYRATGRSFLGVDVQQTNSGGYLLLSIVRNETNNEFTQANVTNLDPKGNINWSMDYDFEENLQRSGDLVLLENDSFIFTIVLDESQMNNVLVKAAPNGEVVWSNGYGNPDFELFNFPVIREAELTRNPDRGYAIFGQQGIGNDSGIYGARLDSLGNLMWANNYLADNILPNPLTINGVQDAQVTQDTGFILGGRTSEFVSAGNAMLIKLDSLGNVDWANFYGDVDVFESAFGEAVAQTEDKGYVLAGFEVVGDFPPSTNGFVMKTDSLGGVLWANSINVDSSFLTDCRFTDVDLTADGDIVVTGFARENNVSNGYALSMKFDQLGNVLTQQRYTQDVRIEEDLAITSTQNNGLAVFGSFAEQDGTTFPYLIKGDELSASSCSDTIVYELIQLDTLPHTALTFTIENVDSVLLKEPLVMDYDSFSVPILSLNSPPSFCEGDPINVTLDATVQGAVSYAWSTGETTPMITVMEEGMYTVEVRVEEDVCFNLCDTTVISVVGPPMVSIEQDLSSFCVDGAGILEAQIQGAANQIEWSTGNSESIIFINQPGTYGVTVTNQCGANEAQIVITEFPEVLPSFQFTTDDSGLCTGQAATVVADVFNASANSVMWATTDGMIVAGTNSPVLTAGTPGTYTITATNNCGTSTEDVILAAVPPTVEVNVLVDELCTLDSAIIGFTGTGISSFEWSTGVTDNNQILVSEQGTYAITVTNGCGDATAETTLNCEFPFDECLMIPNAFTPNNDSNNDGFSPVIPEECTEGITIRRLTVWSRWGKKVFDEAGGNPVWDGTDGDEPAGADVYIYLVDAVNEDGEGRVFKGDVTLIR